MTDDTTKAKDEARARELISTLNMYGDTAGLGLDLEERKEDEAADVGLVAEAFQEVRAERDAELQRAMAVVAGVIAHTKDEELGSCPFCGFILGHREFHDRECLLVAQAFITPTGERK